MGVGNCDYLQSNKIDTSIPCTFVTADDSCERASQLELRQETGETEAFLTPARPLIAAVCTHYVPFFGERYPHD